MLSWRRWIVIKLRFFYIKKIIIINNKSSSCKFLSIYQIVIYGYGIWLWNRKNEKYGSLILKLCFIIDCNKRDWSSEFITTIQLFLWSSWVIIIITLG